MHFYYTKDYDGTILVQVADENNRLIYPSGKSGDWFGDIDMCPYEDPEGDSLAIELG